MEVNGWLKQNCKHEISLNKHRARAFEVQMGIQIQLLPLHYLQPHIMILYRLIKSMPDKLLSRFATTGMAMYKISVDFPQLIVNLKRLWEHKSKVITGSTSVCARVLRRKAFSERMFDIGTMSKEGRMLRMQVKGALCDKDKYNLSSVKGFHSRYKRILAWAFNSSTYLSSIAIGDKDHMQLAFVGITAAIVSIEARVRDLRKQLYFVTKFTTPWNEIGTQQRFSGTDGLSFFDKRSIIGAKKPF
jgi:hypothetical protein